MPLQILNSPPPDPERVVERLRQKILAALPGARVEVVAESPGHFSLEVAHDSFGAAPRVRQHQSVYAAIRELMDGDAAPVHAIDRLVTRTP